MSQPKVSIIILNYNGVEDTVECLESLYAMDYPDYEVIVVDNHSEDSSLQVLEDWAKRTCDQPNKDTVSMVRYDRETAEKGGDPHLEARLEGLEPRSKLRLIMNDRNYGYAGGNNIGIRYASAIGSEYYLLLNNDTIVEDGFLTELIATAERTPGAAFLGPMIYYYHEPDRLWFAGGRISWPLVRTDHFHIGRPDGKRPAAAAEVDYITGCALLARQEPLNEIGLLDEGFFAYFEDVDWCVRARLKGYTCLLVPTSIIWHKISTTSKMQSPLYNYYHARNRIILARKYRGAFQRIPFYFVQIFVKSILALLFFGIVRRSPQGALAYIRGARDGLRYKFKTPLPGRVESQLSSRST